MRSIPIIFAGAILGAALSLSAQEGNVMDDLSHLRAQNADLVWAYDRILVREAWGEVSKNNDEKTEVTIGVIDTGIDKDHTEFTQIDLGSFATALLRDYFRDENNQPRGHGTQVAGIIGADNKSASLDLFEDSPEMNGVLSGASNIPYRLEAHPGVVALLGGGAAGNTSRILAASEGAIARGEAQIVNWSLGFTRCSAVSEELRERQRCFPDDDVLAVTQSWEEFIRVHPGVLFVTSAGNSDTHVRFTIPAGIDAENLIAVAATDRGDHRAIFSELESSSFGGPVHISAPGIDVYAPAPRGQGNYPAGGGDYDAHFSGTSAAAPFVTGVAGLIKAVKSDLTPVQIKQILIESADPIQTNEPDKRLGTGCYSDPNDPINTGCRLNAHKAVCHSLVLACPVLLTIAEAAGGLLQYPDIVAGDGSFLVSWSDAAEGTARVWAQQISADGDLLGAPQLLSEEIAADPRITRVAFHNGIFLVTWGTGGFGGRVMGVRIQEDGTILDTEPAILYTVDLNQIALPEVVTPFGTDAFLVVFWQVNKVNSVTVPAHAPLSEETISFHEILSPYPSSVIGGNTGISCSGDTCVVLWTIQEGVRAMAIRTDSVNWRGGRCDAFLSVFCSGTLLDQRTDGEEIFGASWRSVVTTPEGFLAVWNRDATLFAQRFDSDGGILGLPVALDPEMPWIAFPFLAARGDGTFLVVTAAPLPAGTQAPANATQNILAFPPALLDNFTPVTEQTALTFSYAPAACLGMKCAYAWLVLEDVSPAAIKVFIGE